MTARGKVGKHNSSLTRVRPFFRTLVNMDPSGAEWLPSLLSLFKRSPAVPLELLREPGHIQEIVFETDTQGERGIAPPPAFLKWLIEHPERMTWPKGPAGEFSAETTRLRTDLMGLATRDTGKRQEVAREQALKELATKGSSRSLKKWWAFEGFTKVDCYIATDRLKIYVEGKRTELLSASTAWFPARNQLLRNLEAARENAAGVPFVCLVLRENPLRVSQESVASGLPHMTEHEREDLLQHYIGDAGWSEACKATGVAYSSLPHICC